jgi:DNA (cytosine-5)-methyltransferase 1
MSPEARKSLAMQLNYNVDFRVLKATNFGVPQGRERVYIVGFNRDKVPEAERRNLAEDILDVLESKDATTCLGDILEENSKVDPKYTISDKLLAGHKRRLKAHKAKGNGFGYSVFNRDSPYCNTISARYYKDGSEILIDQTDIGKNPRKLTPRECAHIQGFPKMLSVDAVSDTQNYRQFGNSVSVPVIRAIAEEIVPFVRAKVADLTEQASAVG